MATIKELTYNYNVKENVKELDLSSTSNFKLYQILDLDEFVNLRALILSNNMIGKIENLGNLTKLKILNLQFNQIKVLEGTERLRELQQIFISYNEIQIIDKSIRKNHKLKVLQLSYNDIKNIENISPLYQPSEEQSTQQLNLSVLSLYGNPLISTLNYISFLKMLMPSLMIIDDKDANNCSFGDVCPQEEIAILRQAVNKLIDERNQVINKLEQVQQEIQHNQSSGRKAEKSESQFTRLKEGFINHFSETVSKLLGKLQTKKEKISVLSEKYASNIKKAQKNEIQNSRKKQNKSILKDIKKLEKQLTCDKESIKNLKQMIQCLIKLSQPTQLYHIILLQILFGSKEKIKENESLPVNFKEQCIFVEKLIKSGTGLINLIKTTKKITFGNQNIDDSYVFLTEENLKGKCLIQIIEDFKNTREKQQKQSEVFEEERQRFLNSFEKQTKCLEENWSELNEKKKNYEEQIRIDTMNINKDQQLRMKRLMNQYKKMEKQQKGIINELKIEKQKLKKSISQMTEEYEYISANFERKCEELEEFQKCFDSFKSEKQRIEEMKEEFEEISKELLNKQEHLNQINMNIKSRIDEKSLVESQLREIDLLYKEKEEQYKKIIKKIVQNEEKMIKIEDHEKRMKIQLKQEENNLQKILEENKEVLKMYERGKKNLMALEDKIKNVQKFEEGKRSTIKQLQSSLNLLRQDQDEKIGTNKKLEKEICQKREQLTKYQLKIHEAKLSMESLGDINKSISEMLQRQSELKRSIIELQIEYKNLKEMKASLFENNQMKSYI